MADFLKKRLGSTHQKDWDRAGTISAKRKRVQIKCKYEVCCVCIVSTDQRNKPSLHIVKSIAAMTRRRRYEFTDVY